MGYLKDKSSIIAQLWWSCQSSHRCASSALWLDRTTYFSSPLAASTNPSETLRASPQGGGIQISPGMIPQSPVSQVCGVFSKKVITPCSGGQSRAVATDCTIWGVSRTPLTNNLGEHWSLTLGF